MKLQVGQYVTAIYDFPGEAASDLRLAVGDVVRITDIINDNWLTGCCVGGSSRGSEGSFPSAFVDQLTLPSARTGQKVFLALQDFPSEQNGDLELTKGDVILGTEAVDESWWKGKIGPLKGIFPLTFVVELEVEDGLRSRSASARSNSLKSRSNSHADSFGGYGGGVGIHDGITKVSEMFARALVDVQPQLEGELAFQVGDLIEITEILDADWMYGRCRNKEGLVSAVCVEFLDEGGAEETEPPAPSAVNEPAHIPPHPTHDDGSSHSQIGSDHKKAADDYRNRNASSGSYTSENTRSHDAEITPYGRILYSFTGQHSNELSVVENQIVTLIRHIDDDWTEGEVDGRLGIFPTSFMEVIVDCPYAWELCNDTEADASHQRTEDSDRFTTNENVSSNFQPHSNDTLDTSFHDEAEQPSVSGISASVTEEIIVEEGHEIGLVLHTFIGEVSGDVSVSEGETVEVIRRVDSNWLEIRNEIGQVGLVPVNHLEIIGPWPKASEERISTFQPPEPSVVKKTAPPIPAHQPDVDKKSGEKTMHDSPISTTTNQSPVNVDSSGKKSPDRSLDKACAVKKQAPPLPTHQPSVSKSGEKTVSNTTNQSPTNVDSSPKKSPDRSSDVSTAQKPTVFRNASERRAQQLHRQDRQSSADYSSSPPMTKTEARRASLPARVKPPLMPKPTLAPKPLLGPKPSVIPAKSFSSQRGISSTTHSKVQRGNSLKLLDTLIEDEIQKAKSRSSSQNSDTQSDGSGASSGTSRTSATSVEQSLVSVRNHLNEMDVENREFKHNTSGEILKPISQQTGSDKDSTNFYDKSFDPFGQSDTQPEPLMSDVQSESHSKPSMTFTKSVSLNEDKSSLLEMRRKTSKPRPVSDSAGQSHSHTTGPRLSSDIAFVNKAFQGDDMDGHLMPIQPPSVPSRPAPPAPVRPPVRSPPPRPPVSKMADPNLLQAKVKPPPRPTGPRIALAPSKTPLIPTPVEHRPKPVPHRPAPKAPTLGGNSQSSPNLKRNTSQAKAPPSRQPPRPESFPSPPRRPPPRPTDLIAFSPESPKADENEEDLEEKKEMIDDLKSKLEENRADIKKYEETRSDLQSSLSQAETPEKEAETRDNLEFVDNTLVGLREEESRLKENLFALSPHEGRLEKAKLLAAQHAEEERKRAEEERKKEEEMKEWRREQRSKVIEEILDTEKDYLVSIQLCWETFFDGQDPPSGVDLRFLLGNMEEIADVSQKLLVNLETCVSGKTFEEQTVGKCFTFFADDMKNTYAPYCRNHDDVITAMERYNENPVISDYFNMKLEKMREAMNVFDVAGMLIKPVQRILKYPLLLNELLKNTEDDHPDKEDIVLAIKAMTDVAKAINEYKRRKDLVYKYKKFSDQTFSDKISKLNLHSIKKKSSRIRGRLSTNFGIALQFNDEKFGQEEARFRNLEKAVKIFQRNMHQYLEQSQETYSCQETIICDIQEFYKDKECVEVTRFVSVNNKLLQLHENMRQTIREVVLEPLNELVTLFNAPSNVIEKRFDKLLDYNYQLGKVDNDKELQTAKNDYEAMNAQLLDELPKFYKLAFSLLRNCISTFVLARRDFMDQALRESCALFELPSMTGKSDTMETFNIRHTTVFDHMSLLSFIPRGFNPRVDTVKADRARLRGKALATTDVMDQISANAPSNQSDSQRAYLRQQYPSNKLFTVNRTHNATDLMDISLTEGMLVAVVKELDPMGNKERWFVDDGTTKGFAPSSILTSVSSGSSLGVDNSTLQMDEDKISIHSFDSVEGITISGNEARYSVAGGSNILETSAQQKQQEQHEHQYFYALYDFQARHPNEASLIAGHPVTVLSYNDVDGNSEWWLVDAEGVRGYAPANYMAPMPYS